jgi:hypothetical protein
MEISASMVAEPEAAFSTDEHLPAKRLRLRKQKLSVVRRRGIRNG